MENGKSGKKTKSFVMTRSAEINLDCLASIGYFHHKKNGFIRVLSDSEIKALKYYDSDKQYEVIIPKLEELGYVFDKSDGTIETKAEAAIRAAKAKDSAARVSARAEENTDWISKN